MKEVDQRVIETIEKVRKYVEADGFQSAEFPLENVSTLIDITMGSVFWKSLNGKYNEAFCKVPQLYHDGFKKAMEKGDNEEILYLLELFEYSYRSVQAMLKGEERLEKEKLYKKEIIEIGEAYAKIQYRLHQERQKGLGKGDKKLLSGRGAVYTCLFGDEELYQPDNLDSQIEYICFTDKEERWGKREGAWKFRKLENTDDLDEDMLRTKYMILCHKMLPEYDYSIWIGRGFKVAGEVKLFCEVYGNGNSFLGFAQSSAECMYQDMSYTDMGADDRNIEIRKKIHNYKKEGYPEDNGLIDSKIMVRNHKDPQMCKVMEEWWDYTKKEEEKNGIQTTYFNYVAWKNNYPFSICDLFVYYNPYLDRKSTRLNSSHMA